VNAFIDQVRDRFRVEPVCRTLGVSSSAYYQRASGQRSERAVRHERLAARIGQVHEANYRAYGYRRVHKALEREGVDVGRDQVAGLMRQEGLQGAKRRGKPWRTTTPDPAAQRRPDLVNRQFKVQRPNVLWVADFTYLRCWEGTVFFAFVIDAFSRRVVGWQLASHMRTTLVLDALKMALGTRGHGADLELVHHSDAGSQYTSFDYTQTLNDHWVRASIGTVGDAYDNALAESFVDSFKTELIADRVWRSRSQLELAVVEYIGWFNTARLHSSLGYQTPDEIEADRVEQEREPGLVRTAPPVDVVRTLAAGLSDE
jgi:putative transposase